MAHTIEEIKKIRNGRGTSAASSSDSTKTRSTGHSIEEIRRLGGRSVYTDSEGYTPTKASAPIAQTRPEYRYNSIEEYDKALKKIKPKTDFAKRALNAGINVFNGLSGIGLAGIQTAPVKTMPYTEEELAYNDLKTERNLYAQEHAFDQYKKYQNEADYAKKSQESIEDYLKILDSNNTDQTYSRVYNAMTDEEKAMANYLASNNINMSLQESNRFKDYMMNMRALVDKRSYDEKVANANKEAENLGGKIGLSAKSVGENLVSSIGTGGEYLASYLGGWTPNPYGGASGLGNLAMEEREAVSKDMGNVGSFLYNTGMSVADSALGAYLFGEGYASLMGTNAFNTTYKDLYEKGASQNEILLGALSAGAAETIFEKVSLDRLLKPKSITAWHELIAETLKQAGVEASEETFTELANIFSDEFVNGPNSEVNIRARELKAQGLSDDEIAKIVSEELRTRIIEAAAGGALSGGMMSGLFNGSQFRQNRRIGSNVDRQEFKDSLDTETQHDLENQYGDKWAEEVSDAKMGAIYKDVVNKAYSEDVFKIDKNLNVSDTTTLNGEEAKLTGFTKIGDQVVLNTDKGRADLKDIKLSTNDAQIVTIAKGLKDIRLANAFVKNYGGEDVSDYDMYARYLYEAGKVNADWTQNVDLTDKIISTLGKDKANALYEAGQMSDVQDLKFLKTAYDVAVNEMKSQNIRKGDFAGGSFDADGNFVKDDDFYRNLSRTKKRIYLLCKAFADFAGVNVQVINDDNVASENGHFVVDRPDGGTVMINLAARPYGDSAYGMHSYVLDTLSHELTHWMRGNNEEGYTILEKAISEHLKSKGVYDDLIKNEIESHKKAHPGEKFSEADALEEVVARGCEDMLDDPKTMREVLSTLDVNSLEKLRIAFDKWFERIEAFIEKLMSGFESPNETIKYLRDEYNTFRKLWVEGIQDAIKNAQTEVTDVTSQQMNADKMETEARKDIKEWYEKYGKNGKQTKGFFNLTITPDVFKGIGLPEKTIKIGRAKIVKILKDHPEMKIGDVIDVIDLLHDPMMITSSLSVNQKDTSIVAYGERIKEVTNDKGENENAAQMTSLVISAKTGEVEDYVISSAYYKNSSGIKATMKEGTIFYVKPDKEKIQAWMSGIRLQLPSSTFKLGFVNRIPQKMLGVKSEESTDKGKKMSSDKLSANQGIADERQQNSLNRVLNKVGVEVEDSYAYPKYSLKTWRSSEYSTDAKAAAKALAESMGITVKEAEQYIKDVGSIASQIANDPDRLDYASIEGKSAWVSNPEYGGSLDYSFLCPKRLTYTGTMNAILAKQNDLIFSVDDFLYLRKALIAAGYEAPCSFCFVESARARFGKYNAQFIDIAKEEKLAYIPTAEELSNPDKLEEMRSKHPETFKRYEKFLNSLSQRKPKMLEERRPYNGDILKAFQGKEHTIIEKNLHGGIRFNSFSDFEIVHMIDCMQAIMDMSRVGLAGFGYTKQKAFAQIFGKTGLKIDMSCVAKGVSQDGKHIIFDDVEGMNHKDALKLRNGNVGIVCVVFTDDQVRAALCDERIDYVLPFHRSQWSKKDYEKMGLSLDTKDYTRLQTEKLGTKKAKEGNIPFLSYWNENQTGEETVQRYLDIINEQNKTPIFPFILEKDEKGNWIMPKGKRDHNGKLLNKKEEIKELAAKNYWKLLTEYKMYENDGTPIGQYPVKPIFDMDAANELLTKYDGSHKEFPVSEKVVEDFMYYKKTGESKLLPEWKKYSDKLDSEGNKLTEDQAKFFAKSKARDDNGNLMVAYHGSRGAGFTIFNPEFSDDKRSLFFTDTLETAKSYSATEELFEPDKPMSYEELSDIVESYYRGEWHLEKDGSDYVIKEEGYIGEEPHEIFRGTLKEAQTHFMDSIEDIARENGANYKVYLNLENPLIFDAEGNNWDELPVGDGYDESYSEVDIVIHDDGTYEVDYVENGEYKHQIFKDKESLEKKFGKLYETDGTEIYIDNIYLDFEGNRIPTNTRMLSQYAQDHGYDGVIIKDVIDNGLYTAKKFTFSKVMIAFNANQVKSIYNEHPTTNEDIRYSDKLDSEGNRLTKDQAEYFKGSKVVDEDGRLEVMYHGTSEADFTVFDPSKSDDEISLFFTNNREVAAGYSGTDSIDIVDPNRLRKKNPSLKELQERFEDTDWRVRKDGNEIVIENIEDPDDVLEVVREKDVASAYKEWILQYSWHQEEGEFGGLYSVYLNSENPLIIDANGDTWDEIQPIDLIAEDTEVYDKIFVLDNDKDNNKIKVEWSLSGGNGGNTEIFTREQFKEKFGEDVFKKAFDEGHPLLMHIYLDSNKKLLPSNTRELARYAYDNGYDSLIIENVIDTGAYSSFDVESKVVVVFNSNQIKATNNLHPTNNEDIRQSEKLDLSDASPEVRERVRELEKQVGKLTKENDALKAAKAMAAEKAQKEALMSKIIEQSKTLGKWLLTDPKANPVPQALRKPIINLLRSIDYTTSSYAWRKAHEQQYTKKDQSMAVMMGRINHMLHEIDQDMVNDPEAYDMSQLDWLPAFNKEFEQITNAISEAEKASGEKFNLQQMSVEDLDTLNKLIGALKTSVHNMNKVFGEHNKETVSDLGKEMISYLENIGLKDVDNALTQFMEIDNTTPYYFFKRLGPSGQKLFRILMDAQGEYAFKAQEIEEYAKDVFKGKDVIKWREIVKEFDITEVKYGRSNIAITEEKHIKMTVPQIMSLYCLAKRDQALRHISSGGIKIATFKDGKNEVRQLDNVTLSESDLKMIVGTLTDEQKEVADKLQEFLSTTCSKWGNEVTMQRFGYKAYTEKNYFPINVDQNVLTKEARQRGSSLYQLLNMGFTKPLNPKARNPIEIFDIFETFTIHATDMAQYNAFALPILNVIRVWNYKEVENLETEESDWTSTKENVERDTGEEAEVVRQKYITVKGSIEKAIGKKGNHYIGTLLADLNGDVTHGRADWLDKFSKNYKTAAVAANMQVVMLQPLSYIRAGYAIDNKYLVKAVAMKSNPELIKKYCGIAVWKSMGFYNLAINNGLAHKIMQDDSTKDKLIDKTLWLAGKMDEYTWRKLWNACELEIRDTTKLEVGSEKYYQAVGERLTDLIFGTQVVDSVLTKSELMRGQDTYTKMLTAFNAEPTLGLNIVMDAAEMFDQDRRANGTQHALRTQGANMRKAASVYLAGSLAESVLRAVWGRIRNYDGDEDDETLLHEILTRFLEELNPLRKIPFVKDLYGILYQTIAVFRKDQYKVYADTRMDEASIEALANAIGQIPKVIEKQEITYKDINKIAKGIDATGLPVSNTMRIFKGIWNNTIGRIWESALIK